MIKVIKRKNYYYFLKNNKILKTTFDNSIKVNNEKAAIELSKYLSSCLKSKKKVKKFFLRILFFSYDLDKNSKANLVDKILSYLSTDLVCYRAEKNSELETIQKKLWDPLIIFVENKYKLIFKTTNGIIPIQQESGNKKKLLKILKTLNNHDLTSFYYITNFSNSNIITLNFLANNINFKKAWKLLSLEEVFSLKKWGQDKEAIEKLLEKKNYFNEIINFNLLLKNQEK
jgi:chaperone required for assembly of F1-ATPase